MPLNASHKAIAAQFTGIILDRASSGCASALAKYFAKLAFDRPQDVGAYCRILKVINDTPGIKKLQIPEAGGTMSFFSSLLLAMNEDINDGLEDIYSKSNGGLGNLDITPDNIRFTSSLFGATTLVVGLQGLGYVPTALIRIGLGEPLESSQLEKKEVMAVLACIYLAVAGSKIRDEGIFQSDVAA